MIDTGKAVFLSYASQDAHAAQHLCQALRAAGVEVWFDQSELRGGDAWDASIRRQIKACALFIPLISRNTHAREEGYFRLEWKLGVDRSHLMAANRPFLLPVVIDDTSDKDELVPERFHEVQWTRLPAGQHADAFVERVRRLLSGASPLPPTAAHSPSAGEPVVPIARTTSVKFWRRKAVLLAAIVLLVAVLGLLLASRLTTSQRSVQAAGAPVPEAKIATSMLAGFDPPPHSVAVLPFVNLSGDQEQEYFSDGLTEELLNSLAEIEGLQVAARTSAFSFKGQDNDIGMIARKLNVGTVLEGSVRRSANTVRITAQLINAVTGFHLWSKTYDRDLGDVLKLQTEIASAVAATLKVTLLGDTSAKIGLGGTRNPAAFDAYLRGTKAYSQRHQAKDMQTAIAAYTEAIRLDPNFALALAARSFVLTNYSADSDLIDARSGFEKAQADARRALAIAPDLAEAHLALGSVLNAGSLDFAQAGVAFARALALAPGNALVLRSFGGFAAFMGNFDAGLATLRRALVLDPLARSSHSALGQGLYNARRYEEAAAFFKEAINLQPDYTAAYGELGLAYYGLGNLEQARVSCEMRADDWLSQQCLAVVYDKLGRHAEAQAVFAKLLQGWGDSLAYQYATIFAQWGNLPKALEWLQIALRQRDPGLGGLKTDALLDPLRKEPGFQAIERKLNFPI